MASSTSVLARRRLFGLAGAVFARPREGEGRRDGTRAGAFAPEVRDRWSFLGARMTVSVLVVGSSLHDGKAGVAIVVTVEPENRLSGAVSLCMLCVLARLEPDPTGFLGML
jgi:hypothetical protein